MSLLAQDFYEGEEEDPNKKGKKKITDFVGDETSPDGVEVGKETQPGQFTGIEEYLEENKPETQEMVSDIQTGVQEQQDKFKQSLEGAGQRFRGEVESGGVTYDQGLAKEFEETPFKAMQDKEKLERFKVMRDAKYKGPRQLAERKDVFQPLLQQQQALQTRAQQLQQDPGSLVQQRAQRPITEGQRALNRALVSSTPGAVQSLREQSGVVQNVSEELDRQRKALRELATRRAEETKATAERVGGGLQASRQSMKDRISERIKNLRAEATTSQAEFKEALERDMPGLDSNLKQIKLIDTLDEGELSAIKRAGITPEQFQKLRETEDFIENPYKDVYYRDVDIRPKWMPSTPTHEQGFRGIEVKGKVRYVDGKPILDAIKNPVHRQQVLDYLQDQQETERIMREKGEYIPPQYAGTTYRQRIDGREFDPSVLFSLQNPDLVYREGTVTTPEEYENLKALRELQEIQSPIGFELEDRPDLYGVVEQASGEKTLDEILKSFGKEMSAYEQEAMDRFIRDNPLKYKTYSTRQKSPSQGHNLTWANTPPAPGQGWGGGDTGQGESDPDDAQ